MRAGSRSVLLASAAQRVEGSTFSPVTAAFPTTAGILNADIGHQAESDRDQHGAKVAVDPAGGTGTIAWSETDGGTGHQVWARKLTGATAGPAIDGQVTSFNGHPGDKNANDDLSVASGGGTTWVAFHGSFDVGGGQSRAHGIVRSFSGTSFGPAQRVDGIADGPGQTPNNNAEFPKSRSTRAARDSARVISGSTRRASGRRRRR